MSLIIFLYIYKMSIWFWACQNAQRFNSRGNCKLKKKKKIQFFFLEIFINHIFIILLSLSSMTFSRSGFLVSGSS